MKIPKNNNLKIDIKTEKKMLSTLKKYFGYKEFRPGQKEIIRSILEKRDVLAILPTGGGKSICYQIPALMLDGITIVISPLISLMQDQISTLKKLNIPAALINSTLSSKELYATIENAKNNKYKLIYVSPERLETPNFLKFAKEANISFIAIDEAHCVSTWGHDFRPSYKTIKDFISKLKQRPIIAAFTATATENVKEDVVKLLDLNDPYISQNGFDRPNIYFSSFNMQDKDKIKFISNYIEEHSSLYGIIYCQTRKNVEQLNSLLTLNGFSSSMYHAGMLEETKKAIQNDFKDGKIKVIVATNAFGMGIDKSNVSYVIHYNMPKDIESYYQEAGRAGRDGMPSEAILLYNTKDYKIDQYMITKNIEQNESLTKTEKKKHKKFELNNLNEMFNYASSNSCLRKYILDYFNDNTKHFKKCNNCINCNNKLQLCDITIECQKILSCIIKIKNIENEKAIIDILTGKDTKYIKEKKYNNISTFGILKLSSKSLKFLFNHLIELNCIEQNKENDTLIIPNNSKSNIKLILSAKKQIITKLDECIYNDIIKSRNLEKSKNKEKQKCKENSRKEELNEEKHIKTFKIPTIEIDESDMMLYKLLNLTKKNIASKCKIDENNICLDYDIRKITKYKPSSLNELTLLDIFSNQAIKKYGQIFIDVVNISKQLK